MTATKSSTIARSEIKVWPIEKQQQKHKKILLFNMSSFSKYPLSFSLGPCCVELEQSVSL